MPEPLSEREIVSLINRPNWQLQSVGSTVLPASKPAEPIRTGMTAAERMHRARLAHPAPVRGGPRKV